MKTNYLLPHRLRLIGWILVIPAAVLGLIFIFGNFDWEPSWLDVPMLSLLPTAFNATPGIAPPLPRYWEITETNLLNVILALTLIVGGLFVAFSKERIEDEYIAKLRLESLMWATYVSYGILALCLIFLFDFTFLKFVMINMFTLLVVFIIRFNFVKYKLKHADYEK